MHIDSFWPHIHQKNEVKPFAGGLIAAEAPSLISHVQDALWARKAIKLQF